MLNGLSALNIFTGRRKQLNSPDDLFDLPRKTCTQAIAPEFERQMNETHSLVTSFHRCFGSSFYLLGLLKFLGDTLSFVGPLVLSALVQFIDDKTEPMLFGYLCAAALCIASFTGLFSTRRNNCFMCWSSFIFPSFEFQPPCATSISASK